MKRLYKTLLALGLSALPALTQAQDITGPTQYYLMHSGGCHLAKDAEGRASLESADAEAPQMLTITPTGDGYYTLQAPGGGYLSLSGKWETWFLDDPTSTNAQYKIESAGTFFKKLKCRANSKYLGTDDASAGAHAFSDKAGNATLHYWYLSTDPTEEPPVTEIAYMINPAAERQQIDGWGVSLCWWANMCGKWSDEKIDEIVDWLVSPDGLNFNIFRYNIGGGDDPEHKNCTEHHMGKGKGLRAEMEGFKDSSDGQYIWTRDEAQRKIMLKIKEKRPDAIFEAFSNSAPYYMTYSGCVSGNATASKDNLKPEYYEEFAHYLVDVCRHYKDEYGIEFKTLDPFNEPMTNYWGANGGQEGCHFDVNSQIEFIKVLYPILRESGLKTVISAADETSVAQQVKDYIAYRNAGILDMIGQINTHTYTADDKARTRLKALCDEDGKALWMSEVGAGGTGIAGNFNLARKLIDDVRHIMPSAWIDWQYIEENNDQWCLVKAGSFAQGTYEKVKNYSIRCHFSRFIKKGYTILTSFNENTLAARSPEGDELVIVALNNGSTPVRHKVDLSIYASVGTDIDAYITNSSSDLAATDDCALSDDGKTLSFKIPAMSIATYVVPVTAAGKADSEVKAGATYLVCPRLSASCVLDATAGEVKINNITLGASQLWTLAASGTGYTFTNGNGDILTEDAPNYKLKTSATAGAGQTFLVENLGGIHYKISNGDNTKSLDLEGEKSANGTGVGVWAYAASEPPTHRQWQFVRVPDELGLGGIGETVADGEAPVSITTPQAGAVCVKADAPGLLRVFSASGACVYTGHIGTEPVTIPLSQGYYIVSYSGATSHAQLTVVR